MRFPAILVLLAALMAADEVASAPPFAPGTGTLKGVVRLVPREGVRIPQGGAGYQSRELRDVELVDYSQPGFVVVYLEGPPAPAGHVALTLEKTRWRHRIEPAYAALGRGGTVSLRNATATSQVVSCPALGVLRRLSPGEELQLVTADAGPLLIHVLGGNVAVTVFVAPGPYTVASKRGRYLLADLEPGAATLRVWHPRFPGGAQEVVVVADRALRINLEIGVDRLQEEKIEE